MIFYWAESMSTGVTELDGQHQALIQQINRLEEIAKMESDSEREECILDMLDYLSNYARTHFGDEERQMDTFGCETAKENKEQHVHFLKTISSLRQEYQANGPTSQLIKDIHEKLGDWFINHICTIDSRLLKAVQRSGVWAI